MNSVLAFHEVPDAGWFGEVVEWLQQRYRLLPASYISELFAGSDIRDACHITVDDGHRSFYDAAFPVLQRLRVPATLFVSPAICAQSANFWFQELPQCDDRAVRRAAATLLDLPVEALAPFGTTVICKALTVNGIQSVLEQGRRPGYRATPQNVTVSELKSLADSGFVTLGAHTLRHPILGNESDARSEEEIVGSVRQLTSLINRKIRYFAYPNGLPGIDFSQREEGFLANAGIELAFSTESRGVRAGDTPYRIPRIQISPSEEIRRIDLKLRAAGAWNVLKMVRPRGEYVQRRRLRRIVTRSLRRGASA